MPVVVAASETEAAVSASVFSGVGVGVVSESEGVLSATATLFRRTLSEIISDGDGDHDTDHEALAQFHNKFDLRDTPTTGDAIQWDGDSYSPAVTPYAGTWFDALFVRPDDAHANDDEFVGSIDANWVETLPSGTTTWKQELGRLSVTTNSQTSAHISTILKPLNVTGSPVTIETALMTQAQNGYFYVGLCFSNGTATSSSVVVSVTRSDSYDIPYLYFTAGTIIDADLGFTLIRSRDEQPHPGMFDYHRLIWTGANTWKFLVSHDAVTWMDWFGEQSASFTPTHFGMYVSTWGSSFSLGGPVASFEYVRVTESDLS